MYSLHPTLSTTNQTELSRQAAERYAILSAVRQRRTERAGVVRHGRAGLVRPSRLAVDLPAES